MTGPQAISGTQEWSLSMLTPHKELVAKIGYCHSQVLDKDSISVVKFFTRNLSNPSIKHGIQARIFVDIKPEIFLKKKEQTFDNIKTLPGNGNQYKHIHILSSTLTSFVIEFSTTPTSLYKLLAYFRWMEQSGASAMSVYKLQWEMCSAKKIVNIKL